MKYILYFLILANCTSCLKQNVNYDYSNVLSAISIPNANWPSAMAPLVDTLFTSSTSETHTFKLYAKKYDYFTWAEAVSVKASINLTAVLDYNKKFNSPIAQPYEHLPDSCFEITNDKLTIEKNEMLGFIPITIYPLKIEKGRRYMLALALEPVSEHTVASNAVMLFGMKRP